MSTFETLSNEKFLKETSGAIAVAVADATKRHAAALVSVRKCQSASANPENGNSSYEALGDPIFGHSVAGGGRQQGENSDGLLIDILKIRDDDSTDAYMRGVRTDLGSRILMVAPVEDGVVLVSACAVASPGEAKLDAATRTRLNLILLNQVAKKVTKPDCKAADCWPISSAQARDGVLSRVFTQVGEEYVDKLIDEALSCEAGAGHDNREPGDDPQIPTMVAVGPGIGSII